MTKEITKQAPMPYTTLEQSLALVHKGKRIVELDITGYRQPTLESVVGKPFEEAASSKKGALSLVEVIDQAVQLARESYRNPDDVGAALDTQRPPRDNSFDSDDPQPEASLLTEVTPFMALRDNMLRIIGRDKTEETIEQVDQKDRLDEAIAVWREAMASRRRVLETLQTGANGVYSEAELALAHRTSAHAGATASRHQKEFNNRHTQTEATISSATEKLVGHVVDAKQKEAALDHVKELRNQLASDYFRITQYLRDQATREGQLLEQRANEQGSTNELEIRRRDIAQEIIKLKRVEPDMTEGSTTHFEDGADGNLIEMFSSDANDSSDRVAETDRAIIKKTQLVSEAEDNLTTCNAQLSRHQGLLLNIDAELNDIRDHTPEFIERERELRQTILEDLVVPTLLCITPEVQATIERFRTMRAQDTAMYDGLPKLVKDYADAELWFNDEFAPQVIAQLKKIDPERYAELSGQDTTTGPVTTAQVRRFISSVGIVILNRKDTFSGRIFNATKDYGTTVAQVAYDNANDSARDNMEMMLDSASEAYSNALMRRKIVEQNSELGNDIPAAIQELDLYVRDTEKAIAAAGIKLEAIGYSLREEYKYAGDVESIWEDYLAAQEATSAELAKAEEAEAERRRLEATRKSDMRKLAGLEVSRPDEDTARTSDDYHTALLSGATALSAEATAKSHAVLANMLYERAWKKFEDLNAQSEITTDLMQELYAARTSLFETLEAGSTIGQEVIETAYQTVETLITLHENLPMPGVATEEKVHQQFLTANNREAPRLGEKQSGPNRYVKRVVRTGIAAIAWARNEITK